MQCDHRIFPWHLLTPFTQKFYFKPNKKEKVSQVLDVFSEVALLSYLTLIWGRKPKSETKSYMFVSSRSETACRGSTSIKNEDFVRVFLIQTLQWEFSFVGRLYTYTVTPDSFWLSYCFLFVIMKSYLLSHHIPLEVVMNILISSLFRVWQPFTHTFISTLWTFHNVNDFLQLPNQNNNKKITKRRQKSQSRYVNCIRTVWLIIVLIVCYYSSVHYWQ